MVAKGTGEGAAKGDVDVGDLKVIAACCCTMSSLYLEYPGCCGCVQKGEVLCLEGDCKGCKFIDSTQNDGRCCILNNGGCYCKSPETCCQQTAQTSQTHDLLPDLSLVSYVVRTPQSARPEWGSRSPRGRKFSRGGLYSAV